MTKEKVKKNNYREVFNSKQSLSHNQADFDHGYTKNRKRRIYDSFEIFEANMIKMEEIFKGKHLEYILLQSDMSACFFQDKKNMCFGFYYNGSIQFLCPYENFIDAHLINSSPEMSYKRVPMFGMGFGSGGFEGVGAGSMPLAHMDKPCFYNLIVSYFDKNGEICEFKLDISCLRMYTHFEMKFDEIELFQNLQSDFANTKLNEILAKLKAIKSVTEKLLNKEIIVHEIGVSQLEKINKTESKKQIKFEQELEERVDSENESRRKSILIILGIIAVIIVIMVLINIK